MKIVAVSDLHGHLPEIPPCDLLLVAGDICPDVLGGVAARKDSAGQVSWFCSVFMPWRAAQPATQCVLTWGNHDYCGQAISRYPVTALDPPGAPQRTWALVDGPLTFRSVRIWGTPWSSRFRDWAFMQAESRLKDLYAPIPEGLDILMSHQPPVGVRDQAGDGTHIGSPAFHDAVARTQPAVVICGHVHAGHGMSLLRWSDGGTTTVYNVSHVDEAYQPANDPTEIVL